MSDLLTKFKEICNTDIELPQSGKISVTKLNIEFQNKLFSVLQDLEGEANISINYIQFINNYMQHGYASNIMYILLEIK